MSAFAVKIYSEEDKNEWNQFIKSAKNSTFLFHRDFMDYHSDRFKDFSLMIYRQHKLVAVLPAHRIGDEVFSHKGLTYGELILSKKLKFNRILEVMQHLLLFLEAQNIQHLTLKLIPHIYHRYPAEELRYLLHVLQAECMSCDLTAALPLAHRLKIAANRLEGVKKAKHHQLNIKNTTDFSAFWKEILIPNLQRRHHAQPVHSLSEIELLAGRFPKHIKQYNVYQDKKLVGGTTLFITDKVVHTQYISADEDRQSLGTLDYLFHHLLTEEFKDKSYFDFGTSSTPQGLNTGLLYWKNGFGARGIACETYRLSTAQHHLLHIILD